MENKNIGSFSILDIETVESADYSSLWDLENAEKLQTRRYYQKTFSNIKNAVWHWVGVNRSRIQNLSLEQQEEIMIAEGIIKQDDI